MNFRSSQSLEHVHGVVFLETEGNRHVGRAGHAVSAAGAADLHQFPIGLPDSLQSSSSCFGQCIGLGRRRQGQGSLDLFLAVHAGEDHRDFRPVPDPAKGPFRGRARTLASFQMAATAGGGVTNPRLPPRSGSMTITPRPFAAAYSRPAVPAWHLRPNSCIESGRRPKGRRPRCA